MKENSRITTLVNSKFYPLLLFFVSFVFVTLFSRSTSFLYAFEGADPSIFKQMGRAILKGKILYIDYFDNKGCLLYFIHALGPWLGGDFAIMLMQVVSLTVTLFIWDKILAFYRTENERMVCLGIALFMLLCFYGSGDQTQEWCLPYISYPLLVYFRARKTKSEIRPLQMLFIGLCFGIITFIQINNACAFLGFIAYLWISYLFKKDFRKLIQSVGCFILGWIIIAIPCLLYFYIKAGGEGVYEMVYASFLSNLEYIGVQSFVKWFHWLPYSLFLLSFLTINILNLFKQKDLLISFFISFLLFVGTFGRFCNAFYLIAVLPLCIVSMITFNLNEFKKTKLIVSIISAGGIVFFGSIVFFHFINDLILQNEKEVAIYDNFHRCMEIIPKEEQDSIYNYNLYWHGTHMMEHEKLLQCNRVLYTSLTFMLPTLWKEETTKPSISPKWIILSFDKIYNSSDIHFIQNKYELCCSFQYNNQYLSRPKIGDSFMVYLYKRID